MRILGRAFNPLVAENVAWSYDEMPQECLCGQGEWLSNDNGTVTHVGQVLGSLFFELVQQCGNLDANGVFKPNGPGPYRQPSDFEKRALRMTPNPLGIRIKLYGNPVADPREDSFA